MAGIGFMRVREGGRDAGMEKQAGREKGGREKEGEEGGVGLGVEGSACRGDVKPICFLFRMEGREEDRRVAGMHGYLAYKKPPARRTLPKAHA